MRDGQAVLVPGEHPAGEVVERVEAEAGEHGRRAAGAGAGAAHEQQRLRMGPVSRGVGEGHVLGAGGDAGGRRALLGFAPVDHPELTQALASFEG